jgi:Y-X(10)_GDL-associated radical SAM protein
VASVERAPAPRVRREQDYRDFVPVHVVWELTLACNLKCSHCGSRAGRRRPDELQTGEALEVVDQLARLGTRELTIIGGEAYLRRDWTQIVAHAASHGMYVGMQTGARALTEKRLAAGIEAGLGGLGVSLDGLAPSHDRVRGVAGSFEHGLLTLRRAKAAGLNTSANTQIGPQTMGELEPLLEHLVDAGIGQWQLQLTVAMGNAVDHPELLLQPYQLLELMPLLARLYHRARRDGVSVSPGNNIGYFGPYEHLWRGDDGERAHYAGCSAGQTIIGLEADGTVKGCPSLPTVGYAGGNIRDTTLEAIWLAAADGGALLRPAGDLWGFCASCYYADVCRGGCTWTSHSLLGRPGNNPYCHHRALTLAAEGRRERVVKVEEAGPAAFAIGRFELVEEALDGSPLPPRAAAPAAVTPVPAPRPLVPIELDFCHGCKQFVRSAETTCPFCAGDLAALRAGHEAWLRHIQQVMDDVRALLPAEAARGAPTRAAQGTAAEAARGAPAHAALGTAAQAAREGAAEAARSAPAATS